MNQWITKWLIASILCLMVLAGTCAYLLHDSRSNDEKNNDALAHAARMQVNEMLLYLERHMHELDTKSHVEAFRKLGKNAEIEALVLSLDGNVLLDTSGLSPAVLNPRILLQYDTLQNDESANRYSIAYPVVNERTDAQVGNVIFSIPRLSLSSNLPSPSLLAYLPYFLLSVFTLALAGLILAMAWKLRHRIMRPLARLRDHSEQILKGDYEQRAEHSKHDEIGELYAVFDQMRLEIKHLDARRLEQDRARKELITNISHDLKTPLATVTAYIEAIRAGICPDMDSVMAYIEVMETNTGKMSRLTEDLLLHAIQDLGQISIHRTEQYSRSLFENIIKPIAHYARSAGVTFREPHAVPDVLIAADAHRLEQVFGNLIINALKHTETGDAITVDIEHSTSTDELVITIEDNGEGMSPEDMPFVFERYYQGRSNGLDAAHPTQGSGLGLSICKYIVEAHNGTISFRSMKGEGTRFMFTIPVL